MTAPLDRLRAGLDADERTALAVRPAPLDWRLADDELSDTVVWWPPEPEIAKRERELGVRVTADRWQGQQFDSEEIAAHVARQDPARALRVTQALRKVLEVCDAIDAAALNGEWWEGHYGDRADEIRDALADIYVEEGS